MGLFDVILIITSAILWLIFTILTARYEKEERRKN